MWLSWLKDAALDTGYPVTEVAGWQNRGHGQMTAAVGVVGHHTGTPASAPGDYPTQNVVVNGRSDLAGPLCNLGLGRSGRIYIVAAGCAWHAGASAWAGFTDLNNKFVGIEAESSGNGDWSHAQLDAYPKLVGSLCSRMHIGVDRYCSHRSCAVPHGRKSDPTGIDDDWMRRGAAAFMHGGGNPPPPPPPPPPGSLPSVSYGQTSNYILRLQQFMVSHFPAYNTYQPTGYFGPATAAGMREFQRRTGITSDGRTIGPQTNAQLWKYGWRG